MTNTPLDENQVVELLCHHLQTIGFTIQQKLTTKQRGDDVVASRSDYSLMVEAKGETSAIASKRAGTYFGSAEVKIHVAEALYRAIEMKERLTHPGFVGLAFPENELYRRYTERISAGLRELEIGVFWVSANGVNLDAPWTLC